MRKFCLSFQNVYVHVVNSIFCVIQMICLGWWFYIDIYAVVCLVCEYGLYSAWLQLDWATAILWHEIKLLNPFHAIFVKMIAAESTVTCWNDIIYIALCTTKLQLRPYILYWDLKKLLFVTIPLLLLYPKARHVGMLPLLTVENYFINWRYAPCLPLSQ